MKEERRKVFYLIIIGVLCGGVFVFVVCGIYLICYFYCCKMLSCKCVLGVMVIVIVFLNFEKI